MFADLHLHLDGSIRPSTLQEILDIDPPYFYKGMGLDNALGMFSTTLGALRTTDNLARVAEEICEDAKDNKVGVLEIRFAPQLHSPVNIADAVDAVIEGVGSNNANIILCGLYGESPDVLHNLVDIAYTRKKVVGIDLAGAPLPSHQYGMPDYVEPFTRAMQLGIGRTVHAGEGRAAQEIGFAIQYLHAQRIGHGVTLLDDADVVELVKERGVVIEACLTSNVHTSVIGEIQEHPLVDWINRDIPVCICSDNTMLSRTDANKEHMLALELPGMSQIMLDKVIETGLNANFRGH